MKVITLWENYYVFFFTFSLQRPSTGKSLTRGGTSDRNPGKVSTHLSLQKNKFAVKPHATPLKALRDTPSRIIHTKSYEGDYFEINNSYVFYLSLPETFYRAKTRSKGRTRKSNPNLWIDSSCWSISLRITRLNSANRKWGFNYLATNDSIWNFSKPEKTTRESRGTWDIHLSSSEEGTLRADWKELGEKQRVNQTHNMLLPLGFKSPTLRNPLDSVF